MAKSTGGKIWLIGCIAGVCAMMAFHQGFLHLLHHHGEKVPNLTDALGYFPMAFNFRQIPPLELPLLAVLAIWGGFWGIIIAVLVRVSHVGHFDLAMGLLFGGIAITAAETTALPSLIGLPILNSHNEPALIRAAIMNGTFGFGTVLFLRPFALRG
jgi:hypothetical protein